MERFANAEMIRPTINPTRNVNLRSPWNERDDKHSPQPTFSWNDTSHLLSICFITVFSRCGWESVWSLSLPESGPSERNWPRRSLQPLRKLKTKTKPTKRANTSGNRKDFDSLIPLEAIHLRHLTLKWFLRAYALSRVAQLCISSCDA